MANPVKGAEIELVELVIKNGETTTNRLNCGGRLICGIDLGATLTSTTLAPHHSVDGNTFRAAYNDSGSAISWTVAGGRYLKFDPPLLGYKIVRFVAGSSEGAARTLTVVLAP